MPPEYSVPMACFFLGFTFSNLLHILFVNRRRP